jgi:antitoxin MazE
MRVAKWGKSLTARFAALVAARRRSLIGDDKVCAGWVGDFEATRQLANDEAFKRMRQLRRPLPVGYKFDRVEANERR